MKPNNYNSEIEESLRLFAETLNEKDLRRYAAVEALKKSLSALPITQATVQNTIR